MLCIVLLCRYFIVCVFIVDCETLFVGQGHNYLYTGGETKTATDDESPYSYPYDP